MWGVRVRAKSGKGIKDGQGSRGIQTCLEMILSMVIVISRKPMLPPELRCSLQCIHPNLLLLLLSFQSSTPEAKICITVSAGVRSKVNPASAACCDDHAEVGITTYWQRPKGFLKMGNTRHQIKLLSMASSAENGAPSVSWDCVVERQTLHINV